MELYKKVGGRYRSVGMEFAGFPCNGLWLVQDGRQGCIVFLGEDIPPLHGLRARCTVDSAVRYVMEHKGNRGNSIYDIVKLTLDYVAKETENERLGE